MHKFIDLLAASVIIVVYLGEYLNLGLTGTTTVFVVAHFAVHVGVVGLLLHHSLFEKLNHNNSLNFFEEDYDWEEDY